MLRTVDVRRWVDIGAGGTARRLQRCSYIGGALSADVIALFIGDANETHHVALLKIQPRDSSQMFQPPTYFIPFALLPEINRNRIHKIS